MYYSLVILSSLRVNLAYRFVQYCGKKRQINVNVLSHNVVNTELISYSSSSSIY